MSIDDTTPPDDQGKNQQDMPERREPSAENQPATPNAAEDLIQRELPWGDATKLITAENSAEPPAFRVEASDVQGIRIPAEEWTPRMESYAAQETQPLVDFDGLTPDKIIEPEPIGHEFGSGSEQAQTVGQELVDLYGDAPSSKVSIGQTRAVAADLNARGLTQDDAITAWKTFYDGALEGHGWSYRYANGDVVITARDQGIKDVIVVDPSGMSAPGSTTSHDVLSGELGPVSSRLPGRDRSAG